MEFLTEKCCVVVFSEGSCCGFFLNRSWIIAHATFLLPFIVKNKVKEEQLEDTVRNKNVRVILPKRSKPVSASLAFIWKAEQFSRIVSNLVKKSAGWKFNDADNKVDNSLEDKDYDALVTLLPYFVLLKHSDVPNALTSFETDLQVAKTIILGQKVHITSTPFAGVCPQVFLNSVIEGTVSQVVQNSFILTDAKCLPSTEGAPVYTQSNSVPSILGVVVAPLVWRHNEWLGLSVVCSFVDIINSLHHKNNSLQKGLITLSTHSASDRLSQAVVLVQTLMSWGSGVLVHPNYILTCGHVVGNSKTVRVRQGTDSWQRADVIYSSGPEGIYDLALLHIQTKAEHFMHHITAPKQGLSLRGITVTDVAWLGALIYSRKGQSVRVVGHAVFGEQHGLNGMSTAGVVSKVLYRHAKPVLIQTSCTVQNGASGGAVLTGDGELVGIVTSNTKDQATKTCYPHLNMAVPMVTVWPVIQDYINTKDKSVMQNLLVKDKHVKNMWLLKTLDRSPASKL